MEKLIKLHLEKLNHSTTNDENFLVMEFGDDTSAFDVKTAALENKGKVNNQFNAFTNGVSQPKTLIHIL